MECFTKRNVFSVFFVITICGYILVITGVWHILDTPVALVYQDSTPTTVSETSSSSTKQLSNVAPSNTFNDKESTSSSTSAANNNITGDETISPEYFADYVLPHNYTLHIRQNLSAKNILFHKKPFWLNKIVFTDCEISSCTLTTNRSLTSSVEAVVYHTDTLSDPAPPSLRPMGQIWLAYSLESPAYYFSSFRSTAWRGTFNWTITYRVDSDIFCPYDRLVFSSNVTAKNYTNIASAKSKSVAWFVSNCNPPSKRKQYVEAMKKENIAIDIYGQCGRYKCPGSDGKTCENLLNTTYRFYLSFENSICRDYVTEKFFKTFGIDVVPVVLGGADYKKYFPRGTFIDTADFKSASELVKYLKYLETNLTAYAEILKKKDHYRLKYRNPWCKLCEMLHFVKSEKTYSDLPTWLDNQGCRKPTDI